MLSVPESAKAESASYYYNRGVNKSDAGDYYGAISDYSKAIEINPRDADAYNNRGFSKNKLGDHDGAISDYSKAIEINPEHANAYSNRGISKGKGLQDDKGACNDLKKAASLGSEYRINWLKTEQASWCRYM